MKRWVVVLLVVLAAVVLVSPGIVGRIAERNLESNLEWAAREAGNVSVSGGSFDRGWFTSEGTRRIEIRNEQLRSLIAGLADLPGNAAAPVLIVSTRLDHGLIPVSSMKRESGSLAPALASAVSTVQLDPGNAEPIAIPGEIVTRIGLSGASTSNYRLDAGSYDDASTHAEWQGADVTVETDSGAASLGLDATIEPFRIESGGRSFSTAGIKVDSELETTQYGFNVGSIEAITEAVVIETPDAPGGGFGRLSFEAGTELVDERVNGRSVMSISDVNAPGLGKVAIDMDLAFEGIDAAYLQPILAAFEQSQTSPAPGEALAAIYPAIREDVHGIVASGAELRIERFDVVLPQGTVSSRLRLALPETDPSAFSWPAVLLALHATAELSVPAPIVEIAQAANPQAGALVAMGLLKKEGDVYRMHAEYAKGLLTVNGAPMPLPLPAAR
ncbi:MAG TPA: DUF945 family protein [Woeseiaceae bacterium]|nr:DUF945 family protein [Woeseiaceae bacterium]